MATKISLKKAAELAEAYMGNGFEAFSLDKKNYYMDPSEIPDGPTTTIFYKEGYYAHIIEKTENEAVVTRCGSNNLSKEVWDCICNRSQIAAGEFYQNKPIEHPEHSGHKYVDLGLPSGLLWAEDYIGGYCWGEIFDYTFSKAKKNVEKRCHAIDIKADETMDAARYNWNGKWRLPSQADFQELKDYCKWTWRRYGFIITGPNGNSLFLKATDTVSGNIDHFSCYWTSTSKEGTDGGYMAIIDKSGCELTLQDSKDSANIWPVFSESDQVSNRDSEEYKKGVVKENGKLFAKYIFLGNINTNYKTWKRVSAQKKINTGDVVVIKFLGAGEKEIQLNKWNPVWEMDETIEVMSENFYFEVVVNDKNAYYAKTAGYRYTKASNTMGGGVEMTVSRTSIMEQQVLEAFDQLKEWLSNGAKDNNFWHGLYKKTEFPEKISYGMPGEENVGHVEEKTWADGDVIDEGDDIFTFGGIRYQLYDDYIYVDDKRKKESALKVLPLKGEEKYSGVVTIPESVKYKRRNRPVKEIDHVAFDNCPELDELNLPRTITYFPRIEGCQKLERVNVDEANPDYMSVNGVLFTTENNSSWHRHSRQLVCYPAAHKGESYAIPNFVEAIASGAFQGCLGLKSVSLTDNVHFIGSGAFKDCANLESISLGLGLETIDDNAFEKCTSLASVELPDSVTHVWPNAFKGCTGLVSLRFPKGRCFDLKDLPKEMLPWGKEPFVIDGVYYIPEYDYNRKGEALLVVGDFHRNKIGNHIDNSVKTLRIPDTIEWYGFHYEVYKCTSSFKQFPSLKRLELPKTMTEVNISGISTLQEVAVDEGNESYTVVDNLLISKDRTTLLAVPQGYMSPKLVIPEGIATIGQSVCCNMPNLEELIIPDSVQKIEKEAFSYCKSLRKVQLGKNVVKIAPNTFCYTAIESIALPPKVRFTNMNSWDGKRPFYGSALKEYILQGENELYTTIDGVLYTKNRWGLELRYCPPAFKGHLQIPEGVTYISKLACNGCTALTSVYIPDGMKDICDDAFSGCTNLQQVEIDGHVDKICGHCFFGCTKLKEIDCIGVRKIEDTAFRGVKGLKLILPYDLEKDRSQIEIFMER